MQPFSKKIIPPVALFLFYSLVFFIYADPLWAEFSQGYIGVNDGNSDANQYAWNAFIFKKALTETGNPFFTDMVLFPKGTWLFFHTYTPIIGLLHLLIPNSATAVNLALFLSFVLSGIGGYYFCKHFVKNTILAVAAGLIFSFCPYKTAHLFGHFHLMLTATIPFFLLCFLKGIAFQAKRYAFTVKNWKYVFICILLGIISFLSDYYTLFFLLYFCVGYAIFQIFLSDLNWKSRRTLFYILGIFIVSNLLLKLLKSLKLDDKGGFWWGGDLTSYFIAPTHLHSLTENFSERFYASNTFFSNPNSVENIVFPGYALLALTLLAVFWVKKPKLENGIKPLLFLTVIFFMITLPDLKVLGKGLFKMPTALLHYVPVLNNIRCPTRINVMLMLVWPVCVFYFLNIGFSRHFSRIRATIFGVIILAVIGMEFRPKTYPMILHRDIPQAYQELAKMEGEVVFTFPFGIRDGMEEKGKIVLNDLFYQILHQKKMPGAYISRLDKTVFENFDKNPVVHDLLELQLNASFSPDQPKPVARTSFLEDYHPDFFLLGPEVNQAGLLNYLHLLYPAGQLKRYDYQDYILLKVVKP